MPKALHCRCLNRRDRGRDRTALDDGAFIVVGGETTTISSAGGSGTTTVVDTSANGTLLSESIVSATLGSAARTVTVYANGDGNIS
jgi:hypothetical protein